MDRPSKLEMVLVPLVVLMAYVAVWALYYIY